MWKWQPTYDAFLNAVQDLTPDDRPLAQTAADTVRAAWTDEGKTTLSQHRELIKQFRKRLKDDLPDNHVGLVVLNLSTQEWTESARSTIQLTADHNQPTFRATKRITRAFRSVPFLKRVTGIYTTFCFSRPFLN